MDKVNLNKFMGSWYVIANIPTFIETNAYNATESYERGEDNQILTTFSFREGSFDGEQKTYNPVGFVSDDPSNAVWGMRFIWPFKADFRILYVDKDYTKTIIGRNKRDYLWIMSRTPKLSDDEYQELLGKAASAGYDLSEVRLVPQENR